MRSFLSWPVAPVIRPAAPVILLAVPPPNADIARIFEPRSNPVSLALERPTWPAETSRPIAPATFRFAPRPRATDEAATCEDGRLRRRGQAPPTRSIVGRNRFAGDPRIGIAVFALLVPRRVADAVEHIAIAEPRHITCY
jgi:hypothetical protein